MIKTFLLVTLCLTMLPFVVIGSIIGYTFVRWQFMKKCEDDIFSVDIVPKVAYNEGAKREKTDG